MHVCDIKQLLYGSSSQMVTLGRIRWYDKSGTVNVKLEPALISYLSSYQYLDSGAVYNSHLTTSPPQEITAIIPTCQCSIMITANGDLPTDILYQSVLLTT